MAAAPPSFSSAHEPSSGWAPMRGATCSTSGAKRLSGEVGEVRRAHDERIERRGVAAAAPCAAQRALSEPAFPAVARGGVPGAGSGENPPPPATSRRALRGCAKMTRTPVRGQGERRVEQVAWHMPCMHGA